jgi:hypothetical protein
MGTLWDFCKKSLSCAQMADSNSDLCNCPNICPNSFRVFVRIPHGGASKNRTYDLVIISDAL